MSKQRGGCDWLSRAIGAALLLALASVALLGALAPWSPSGWVLLGASGLAAASGFVGAPRWRRTLRAAGGAALVVLVIVRVLAAEAGMPTLPGGTSSRWLGRIVDEQDVALLGSRLLVRWWPVVPEEREGLVREMGTAYAEMRRDAGVGPSPVLDTTLDGKARTGSTRWSSKGRPSAQRQPGVPSRIRRELPAGMLAARRGGARNRRGHRLSGHGISWSLERP